MKESSCILIDIEFEYTMIGLCESTSSRPYVRFGHLELPKFTIQDRFIVLKKGDFGNDHLEIIVICDVSEGIVLVKI